MNRKTFVFRLLVPLLYLFATSNGPVFSAEPLRIAVIGGSGTIGQRVVREALDRGHMVTLIARDPAKVTERRERLTVVQGDVLDHDSMARIAADQHVVISAIGSARAEKPNSSLYLEAADSLITALRSLGDAAPRLIPASAPVSTGSVTISSSPTTKVRAPFQWRITRSRSSTRRKIRATSVGGSQSRIDQDFSQRARPMPPAAMTLP